MTDSEKLDLLLSEMQNIKSEMQDFKKDVASEIQNVKSEMQDFKKDVASEMQNVKSEMQDLKKDIASVKRQLIKSTAELKAMDKSILDEVERVHGILDQHKEDKSVHTA